MIFYSFLLHMCSKYSSMPFNKATPYEINDFIVRLQIKNFKLGYFPISYGLSRFSASSVTFLLSYSRPNTSTTPNTDFCSRCSFFYIGFACFCTLSACFCTPLTMLMIMLRTFICAFLANFSTKG